MRILQTIRSVDPRDGGPIEGIKQLGANVLAKQHEMEVLSLDSPEEPWAKDFPLRIHTVGPAWSNYGYAPGFAPWLRQHASTYDVIIVNGLWQYHGLAVWRALRGRQTPYVVFTHGMLDPWFKRHYPFKHLKKWAYWPWAEYRILRDAAAVFFTAEEERILAKESFWLYKANERVVSLGTQAPPTNMEGQKNAFYDMFPQLRGKRIILFMGRIHPKKGCDLIIQSFSQVFADQPDWQLVIAGPDQVGWQATLQSLAADLHVADRITWTGMLSGNAKWGSLRTAELLFLPSHQENFGIVVAEALACGLPVLISNKINIWREIQRQGAGLVGQDDIDGAISLLSRWISMNKEDKCRMREQTSKCFYQHFDIASASGSLLQNLQLVISSSGENVRYV